MTGAQILDIGRDSIFTLLIIAAPMLITSLVVGVAISLVQALTQIQEMTLVFVPKIILMFIVLILSLPFMGQILAAHTDRIMRLIITSGT